MAKFQNINL